MDKSNLIFPYSLWYILLCVLVGAAYAFFLYQKKYNWSERVNYALAGIRFVFVTLICILLLAPVIRKVKNTVEKPTVVFALDNSQSLRLTQDTTYLKELSQKLIALGDNLKAEDFEVDFQTFDDLNKFQNVKFDYPSSDLSKILGTIQNNYENRNLDKVVLISDGIHNQGLSPVYSNYSFPVMTVGLGDTTQKKDLKIRAVFFNKIAYLGNQFPIVAEIQNIAFSDRPVTVSLLQGGKTIQTQSVNLKKDDIAEVKFLAKATQKGMQRYTVAVQVLDGELTATNNYRDVFVEVIDGKEKILMVGYAPHPDFKAFKNIIEKNENYSFEAHILGIGQPKEEKYDLIIAHQVPDMQGLGNALINKFKVQGTPIWYIVGAQTNLNAFTSINTVVDIRGRLGQTDEVTAAFNVQFNKFNFDVEKMKLFQKLPPLNVPYGTYNVKENSDILLYQKVGSVQTNRPMLVINSNQSSKSAVLVGEGLWHWRLEEYATKESQEVVDDLVLKVIQYLSSKEDKRKLRVYTTNNEYYDYEKVVFEAEAYNDIYEKIYDVKVSLNILSEDKKAYNYSFVISEGNSKFEVSGLPKGVYSYRATAEILGKMEQATGEFSIKDLQLEALTSTADHNLLRQLSQQTEGKFYLASQLQDLEKEIISNRKPNTLHSSEELLEIIHLKWLFFLIVTLATIEWVTRKYLGSY